MIKKVRNEKFLGVYKHTVKLSKTSEDVFEVYWCDSQGKILNETKPVKAYLDYVLTQEYLFAFADGFERGMDDGLDIA